MELKDIKKNINEKFKLGEKEVSSLVNSFFHSIIETAEKKDKVSIPHFGVFKVKAHKSYTARNPQTGEPVEVPAKNKLHFKPSKDFKEFVNQKIKNEQKIAEEKYKLKKEKEKIIPFDDEFVPDPTIKMETEPLSIQEVAMPNVDEPFPSNENEDIERPNVVETITGSVEKKFLIYFSAISVFFLLLFFLFFLLITKTSFLHPLIEKEVHSVNQKSGLTQTQIDRRIKEKMDAMHLDVAQSQNQLEEKIQATENNVEAKVLASVQKQIKHKTGAAPIIRIIKYKVRKGDSLWDIAKRKSKNPYNWVGVYQTNGKKIQNPDLIYPGQIILVPIIIESK